VTTFDGTGAERLVRRHSHRLISTFASCAVVESPGPVHVLCVAGRGHWSAALSDHVFVAFSGYREGDNAANVWETKNGGASWTNISGNLHNAPMWMLTYDKANKVLYAGSSFGAYYHYQGAGTTWLGLGTDLPNCPTFDLKLSADGTLFASAYGRGIWQIPAAPALTFAILKGFVGQFSTSPTSPPSWTRSSTRRRTRPGRRATASLPRSRTRYVTRSETPSRPSRPRS
jgi:hypothetical protein